VIATLILSTITFLIGIDNYFLDPVLSLYFSSPNGVCVNKAGTELTGPGSNQVSIATYQSQVDSSKQFTCACSFKPISNDTSIVYFNHNGSNNCDFFASFLPLYKAIAGFEVMCGVCAIALIIMSSISLCCPFLYKYSGDIHPSNSSDLESAEQVVAIPQPQGIAMTPTQGYVAGGVYTALPTAPVVVGNIPAAGVQEQTITCQACNQSFSFVRSYVAQSSVYCASCGAMNLVSA